MIYPKKNKFIRFFLDNYARWIIGKHFHRIQFNTLEFDRNKPTLLISNHFSIWDGIILYWLNMKFFKKRFHVMILEQTSKKEPFLKYGGAFTVEKNRRSMIYSLAYARNLLNDPRNLLLIFPQGKLYSNFVDAVQFEKGIFKIIENSYAAVQFIFAATFIENFQHKKPVASVYLKNWVTTPDFEKPEDLTSAYQQHYESAKLKQTEIII